ncbi:MAG TPA: hypothetical protein VLY24_27500 [Bryobacteraceae bacterium]|nr:hypothetical protein [Bryobacteraceae bacterium]
MDPGVVERAWVFGEEVRGTGSGLRALPILVVLSRRVGVDFDFSEQAVVGEDLVVSKNNLSLSGSLGIPLHYIRACELVAQGLPVGVVRQPG